MKRHLQMYAEELSRIRNRARLHQYALLLSRKENSRAGRGDQSAGRDRKQNH
jgi:hypothetical protein